MVKKKFEKISSFSLSFCTACCGDYTQHRREFSAALVFANALHNPRRSYPLAASKFFPPAPD